MLYARIAEDVWDPSHKKRLRFLVKGDRYWWNYFDSEKPWDEDYQRCSDKSFWSLEDAKADAFKRFGF